MKRAKKRKNLSHVYWLKEETKQRLAAIEDRYYADLPSEPIAWSKLNLLRSPSTDMANTMMQAQYASAGLEPRNPMLTKKFIEFSAATPEHIRLRAGERKFVHRRAMQGILPEKILERQTKADFPSESTDGQFAEYVQRVGPQLLSEICDLDGVARLMTPNDKGFIDDDRSWEVWGVYACAAFLYEAAQE